MAKYRTFDSLSKEKIEHSLLHHFGDHLKAALKGLGLTQKEAAERLQITQATVNYYCNLKKAPREKTIKWMAVTLGIPSSALTGVLPSGSPSAQVLRETQEYREKNIRYFSGEGGARNRHIEELRKLYQKAGTKDRENMRLAMAILFPNSWSDLLEELEE